MSISKREKTLIVMVLILAVLCVYYIFFLKPYMDDMSELTVQKETKQIQVDTSTQQKRQIEELDRKIAEKKADISSFSQDISQGLDQPPILVYLEKTVNEHAKKMMFSFERVKQVGQMTICPVNITMISSYDGLKKVLSAFSEGKYVIRVTELSAMHSSQYSNQEQPVVYDPATDEEAAANVMTQPEPQSPTIDIGIDNPIEVTLSIEVFSIAGEIPADKTYEFDSGDLQYGGDIFY